MSNVDDTKKVSAKEEVEKVEASLRELRRQASLGFEAAAALGALRALHALEASSEEIAKEIMRQKKPLPLFPVSLPNAQASFETQVTGLLAEIVVRLGKIEARLGKED